MLEKNLLIKLLINKTIHTILKAAPPWLHQSDFSQPWNFISKKKHTRIKIKDSFLKERLKSMGIVLFKR